MTRYAVIVFGRTQATFSFAYYGGEMAAHRAALEYCSAFFSWTDHPQITLQ